MAIQQHLKDFVALLRDRWRWWAIPMVVMLLATLWLLWSGQHVMIQPFQYGPLARP